jgi:Ca-activated chloride channel family protein
MQRYGLRPLSVVVCLSLVTLTAIILWPAQPTVFAAADQSAGSLKIISKDGSVKGTCPLRHTEVRGAISGFLARVTVTQTFENTATQKIEAIYTFPLPENAAVDDMAIQIGNRTVRGVIRKREEARAIYEQAKRTGHVAALLDQERPNIFTQSVANILPGEQVTVTISYLQTLEYEAGAYQFVFPMVVGPRYIPGQPIGKQAGGWAPDTNKVPDASKITPQVTPRATRAGHDISIELAIDAGVPLVQLSSSSHKIEVDRTGASSANVKLRNLSEIPNKDFILKYDVAGEQISDAILSQADSQTVSRAKGVAGGAGGYFTLILQPPAQLPESDITPKELVFVLDTSGSMMGLPIEKAKDLINHALDELYPGDTFNLITFSGDTRILFPEPVYPTAENIRKAREVLNAQHGSGGTEMMKAIRAALVPSDSQDHLRVVCFLTDGYVGNDLEIIGEVQRHPNARVFAYGIGTAVNRFLIESMAKAGRGDSEVVTVNGNVDAAAHRLYQRLRSPVLTDISIDWHGLPVSEVYPRNIPDLFTGKPLVLSGRYTTATSGRITIHGKRAGDDFTREIPVHFNSTTSDGGIVSAFWARRKIDDLMSQDWAGLQTGNVQPEVQKGITQLGLSYRLMTQFTSFVAVEERVVTTNGKPQTVEVPVEMPDGVSYEGIVGGQKDALLYAPHAGLTMWEQMGMATTGNRGTVGVPLVMRKTATPPPVGSGVGIGSGYGGGMGVSVANGTPVPPPPPSATVSAGGIERLGELSLTPDIKPRTDRALLESKLSPAVLVRFDCWKNQAKDCKLAPDGTIEIQMFLTKDPAAVLEQLKAAGLEVLQLRSKDKAVTGRVSLEKLIAVANLDTVRFVAPLRP